MMSNRYDPDEHIDMYAVQLVVREGVWMNLNKSERVLAAQLCKVKGLSGPEVAERMRITEHLVGKYWRIEPPFPLDLVSDTVIGAVKKPEFHYTQISKKHQLYKQRKAAEQAQEAMA